MACVVSLTFNARMGTGSYRELRVWLTSIALARDVYAVTRKFPRPEVFALTSQLRRAASSIASNIAEGQARGTRREFLPFIAFARGSLAEIDTHLFLARELTYISDADLVQLNMQIEHVGRMLKRLEQALRMHEGGTPGQADNQEPRTKNAFPSNG
jgi:four helix bundle protein